MPLLTPPRTFQYFAYQYADAAVVRCRFDKRSIAKLTIRVCTTFLCLWCNQESAKTTNTTGKASPPSLNVAGFKNASTRVLGCPSEQGLSTSCKVHSNLEPSQNGTHTHDAPQSVLLSPPPLAATTTTRGTDPPTRSTNRTAHTHGARVSFLPSCLSPPLSLSLSLLLCMFAVGGCWLCFECFADL